MTKKNKNTGKKVVFLGALICLLMLGGTMAWLTSESELTNVFTVGQIKPIEPGKEPTGPTGPINPGDPDLTAKLNGNLYEPDWKPNSKLMPGIEIPKNPYVGVGPGSEECYVYVYVDSTMPSTDNDVYFEINTTDWEPVENSNTIAFEGNKYTEGLFCYIVGLNGSEQSTNTWTKSALFDKVVINEKANINDFMKDEEVGKIVVRSFVHQKKDENRVIDQSVADAAAKEAFKIK